MYDITRSESFHNLKDWLSEIRANADPDVVIYLVGNRYDLDEEEREIAPEEGEKFYKDNNLQGFRESSAKTGHNVDATFEDIATMLVKTHADRLNEESPLSPPKTHTIRRTADTPKKKKKCC